MPQRLVQRTVQADGKGVIFAAGVAAAFCVGAAVLKASTRSRATPPGAESLGGRAPRGDPFLPPQPNGFSPGEHTCEGLSIRAGRSLLRPGRLREARFATECNQQKAI